ncbi:MAG: undecaprenyl-diphosphatase UppP [Deltaproteobacteria bacterium]|nr:undecaprenyl-diphosphatase UppP [Deltaproteobacteria bacterium]
MTILQAAVLGLVQGITEFLPISSTAHLRVVPALLSWPDGGAAFAAVIQLGTLLAVVGFFLRDLGRMLAAAARAETRKSFEARMLFYIVAGTVPIGVAGVLGRHAIEGPLRSLAVIASMLVAVAVLMAVAEKTARFARAIEAITLRDAVLVGLAQALALVPGTSRSGITLVAAMLLGFRRDAAARFSFLLSIPAVAAAGLFELPKLLANRDVGTAALLAGLLAAAVSGYLSVAWLLRFLRTRTTYGFVVYRVILGLFLLSAIMGDNLL